MLTTSQAFRPGNVDLPANLTMTNREGITAPDVLTDLDLLPAMPDVSLLLSQPYNAPDFMLNDSGLGRPDDFSLIGLSSQFPDSSIEQPRTAPKERLSLVADPGLDLEFDDNDIEPTLNERSIENVR